MVQFEHRVWQRSSITGAATQQRVVSQLYIATLWQHDSSVVSQSRIHCWARQLQKGWLVLDSFGCELHSSIPVLSTSHTVPRSIHSAALAWHAGC